MALSFLEEWRLELAGEIAESTGYSLPQILSRAQVGAYALLSSPCLRLPFAGKWTGLRCPEDRVATPSVAEVGQILAAASSLRDACLLRLYYATGMRRNEVMEARYCDSVPEEQRIFVRKGKSDKDRYVLVDALTLEMLRRWRPDWPPQASLFDLKESRIGEIFRTCADRCGVRAHYARLGQKLTLHSLRDAFASHCYANGMHLQTLKLLLGHARNTLLYIDWPDQQLQLQFLDCHPWAKGQG